MSTKIWDEKEKRWVTRPTKPPISNAPYHNETTTKSQTIHSILNKLETNGKITYINKHKPSTDDTDSIYSLDKKNKKVHELYHCQDVNCFYHLIKGWKREEGLKRHYKNSMGCRKNSKLSLQDLFYCEKCHDVLSMDQWNDHQDKHRPHKKRKINNNNKLPIQNENYQQPISSTTKEAINISQQLDAGGDFHMSQTSNSNNKNNNIKKKKIKKQIQKHKQFQKHKIIINKKSKKPKNLSNGYYKFTCGNINCPQGRHTMGWNNKNSLKNHYLRSKICRDNYDISDDNLFYCIACQQIVAYSSRQQHKWKTHQCQFIQQEEQTNDFEPAFKYRVKKTYKKRRKKKKSFNKSITRQQLKLDTIPEESEQEDDDISITDQNNQIQDQAVDYSKYPITNKQIKKSINHITNNNNHITN